MKEINKLIIVESPSKCKKIEQFLGPEYKCIASFGHLRSVNSLDQIIIKNNKYDINYKIDSHKKTQIQYIQSQIDLCREVILATDDDREGEAIAWHICQIFGLSVNTTKRIKFNEISQNALINAINNPTVINIDMVESQKTRQILDLLVGFKLSPILWKCISNQNEKSLSAGRCQTPALRLIYENYVEIQNTKAVQVYETIGYFTNKNLPFLLNRSLESEKEVKEFLYHSIHFNHTFFLSKPIDSSIRPPEPFITSTLLQYSSNELHLSPKETMKFAQQLYENGYITYMRTDNKRYSKDCIEDIQLYIQKTYSSLYINTNINHITIIQNESAHEAIRPVNINIININNNDEIDKKAKKLYNIIWKRTIESCMNDYKFIYILGEINAYNNYKFIHRSEKCIFPGFKIIEKKYEIKNSIYDYLTSLRPNISLNYNKIISNCVIQNSKAHYTEAKLIHLLEEKGIGRPSTYSMIVDKIQERGYVSKQNIKGTNIGCKKYELEKDEIKEEDIEIINGNEKNKLVLQPLGKNVLEFLLDKFGPLFEYEFTHHLEKELDGIANGELSLNNICNNYQSLIENYIDTFNLERREIKIDDSHSYMIGKNGPVIKSILDNKVIFNSVRKDIDISLLEGGQYKIEDVIEPNQVSCKSIGIYKKETLYLKKGKFGIYAQWGNEKKPLKKEFGNRPLENINLEEVTAVLENMGTVEIKNNSLLRILNKNISIRKGQFGDYIFYKSNNNKKAEFFKLNDFKDDYLKVDKNELLEWIKKKYKIF